MDRKIEIRKGRTIHYLEHINAAHDTCLFLIHGLGGRAEQWREQIPFFASNYNLIIPDLYGHGSSNKPPQNWHNPYQFSDFITDLESLFQRYQHARNIIIGHSYGGALGTMLAHKQLTHVHKLILISPLPCTSNIKIPLIYYLTPPILEWLRPWLTNQFVKLAFYNQGNSQLINTEMAASLNNPMHLIKAVIKGMQEPHSLVPSLLTTPALTILGKHDGIVPPALSENFYKQLPLMQFYTLENTAHMGLLEQPKMVNQLISDFITFS